MQPPLVEADASTAPGARRWTPAAALSRAAQVLRDEGPRSVVARALGETVYRRLLLLERDLAAPATTVRAPGPLEFRFLGERDVAAYEQLRPGRGSQAAARLARGDRCYGTWLDGRLVAVRWLATDAPNVEYLGLRLPLARDEVYTYDTFTDPTNRGRGISTASQLSLFALLRAEGYGRSVRAVLPENRAAVRDAARAGYRVRGRIGYVRLGPWRREFVRRAERGS